MKYRFRCDKCIKVFEVDIPMNEYNQEKDKQFCSECNSKLERIIEWNGPACNLGGYSEVGGVANWQSGK